MSCEQLIFCTAVAHQLVARGRKQKISVKKLTQKLICRLQASTGEPNFTTHQSTFPFSFSFSTFFSLLARKTARPFCSLSNFQLPVTTTPSPSLRDGNLPFFKAVLPSLLDFSVSSDLHRRRRSTPNRRSNYPMADNEKEVDMTSQRNDWEVPKNVDHEEGEDPTPRGNEWEVVSLTASAYAAAPGPTGNESIHEERGTKVNEDDEAETSRPLFMSKHFVFPPSEHENLPIEPFIENPKGDNGGEDVVPVDVQQKGKSESKEGEDWEVGVNVPEEFPGIQVFDEKGNRTLSIHDPGFDEAVNLHGLNVDNIGQDVYAAAKFSSFHSGKAISGSAAYDEILSDPVEQSQEDTDSSSLISQSPKSGKEEFDDSELPCAAWWKRRVASLCAQAKETNAFWSIFVAAAVMGLVLIGQRWQQERWQVLQQRWQLSVSDEKSGRILSRLKDVIIGGSRRGTYITAASTER